MSLGSSRRAIDRVTVKSLLFLSKVNDLLTSLCGLARINAAIKPRALAGRESTAGKIRRLRAAIEVYPHDHHQFVGRSRPPALGHDDAQRGTTAAAQLVIL